MPIPANGEYLARIVRTTSRVLDLGKAARLFDDEVDGWCTVMAKDGSPILGFRTAPLNPEITSEFQRQAGAHLQWILSRDRITSSRWMDAGTNTAVAVNAYDFYLAYASSCPNRLWNEAIAVVVAIRMHQFSGAVLKDQRLPLHSNGHIAPLLAVAHWLE